MYAIIKTGGKQYCVEEGKIITVEKLDVAAGDEVTFEEVLLISGDAVKNPQNVYVPVGTKVHEIIDAVGGYKDGVDDVVLLAGGPMMGRAVPNDRKHVHLDYNQYVSLLNISL